MNENSGRNTVEKKTWDRWCGYLRILLYLHIAGILNVVLLLIPGSDTVVPVISAVLALGFGYCLLRLAPAEKGYRQAGILQLAALVCSLGQWLNFVPQALSLASSLCTVIACYYEFYAHSAVVTGLDQKLGKKWKDLFVYQIVVSVLAMVGMTMAMVVVAALEAELSAVGIITALVLAGLTIGLDIIYLIYMKRTISLLQS